MTHPFEIELEVTLPADPERVWEAIATGPGIDSWFMGRSEVEPREGGVAAMDTGGHGEQAVITAYEPGKRFASRTPAADDGRFSAFEYLIEGRDGSGTVLRVVHSGLLGDDWQDEYDALRRGWPFHLNTLREYLAHFPGRTALPVFAMASSGERSGPRVRSMLDTALSLPELAGGEVVWSDDERFGVRTGDAIYTFHHGSGLVAMFHHLFGPDTAEAEASWQRWLSELFA
ncbi:MAG: SRPBCC family protein [Catenulispora sp.]